MANKQIKTYITWGLLFLCVPLTIFYPQLFGVRRYYLATTVFTVLCITRMFSSFENSQKNILEIQIITVLCALAVAGRMVFAGIPFVKPVAAIVIITGACFGPTSGFVCGAMSMLVSNFLFSQGPWTLWQMMSFGVCGLLAGIVFKGRMSWQKPLYMAIFGFIEYLFITGPILDISGIFMYSANKKMAIAALLISGFSVNLIAAISTFIFLIVLSKPIMSKIDRLVIKYNL